MHHFVWKLLSAIYRFSFLYSFTHIFTLLHRFPSEFIGMREVLQVWPYFTYLFPLPIQKRNLTGEVPYECEACQRRFRVSLIYLSLFFFSAGPPASSHEKGALQVWNLSAVVHWTFSSAAPNASSGGCEAVQVWTLSAIFHWSLFFFLPVQKASSHEKGVAQM